MSSRCEWTQPVLSYNFETCFFILEFFPIFSMGKFLLFAIKKVSSHFTRSFEVERCQIVFPYRFDFASSLESVSIWFSPSDLISTFLIPRESLSNFSLTLTLPAYCIWKADEINSTYIYFFTFIVIYFLTLLAIFTYVSLECLYGIAIAHMHGFYWSFIDNKCFVFRFDLLKF